MTKHTEHVAHRQALVSDVISGNRRCDNGGMLDAMLECTIDEYNKQVVRTEEVLNALEVAREGIGKDIDMSIIEDTYMEVVQQFKAYTWGGDRNGDENSDGEPDFEGEPEPDEC